MMSMTTPDERDLRREQDEPRLLARIAELEAENARLLETAEFLFARLDDIDTASDIAKGNDAVYRRLVEVSHKRRFEVATTDGYRVSFDPKNPLYFEASLVRARCDD